MTSVYSLADEPNAFGCRVWLGKRDRDGYGVHGTTKAHIAAYVEHHGAVPTGKVIDHLCRVRACCRIVHLEAVTQSENQYRKGWVHRARKDRCASGHDMRTNSVITEQGGRVCRRCNTEGP